MFDRSAREDGTFSREDFAYDQQADIYLCPAEMGQHCSGNGADPKLDTGDDYRLDELKDEAWRIMVLNRAS